MIVNLERWPSKKRERSWGLIALGYKVNPDDPYDIIPDPDVIVLLEKAFDHLDAGSSYREMADWLTTQLNQKISHQSVSNLYHEHRFPFVKKTAKKNRRKGPSQTKETRKKIALKNKIIAAQKKLDKMANVPDKQEKVEYDLSLVSQQEREVVFLPNEGPQTDFLASDEQEVLYGGAAGGGKSYALLADAMRYFDDPNFVGLLLRRTNDELRELKWESQKLYTKVYPKAVFKEKDSMWVFPSGAKLWMSYLDADKDVMRYQGQAFSWIGFDELTQWSTPFPWEYLRSRLRKSAPLHMRATSNPGGPGHQWVKKMFVDPCPPNKAFWAQDIETQQTLVYPETHEKAGQPLFQRKFIPARLYDNPYLIKDGNYEASLLSLPEDQRRKLLDGDWTVTEGAAFPEFREHIHVCEPFELDPNWRRFRSCDYGYSSHSAVHWYTVDPAFGTILVYRELYVSKKTGKELAWLIRDIERKANERVDYGVLDSSVWHQRGHYGPSIAEEMIAEGVKWRPADRTKGSRTAGKNRLHELLKVDPETERPGILFFNNCRQIIADLPTIPTDPDGNDDIDPKYVSDHAYDSLRYGIMSRPRPKTLWELSDKPTYGYQPADGTFGY